MTGALVALGFLVQDVMGDAALAREAMALFVSQYPISTRSAEQSQSTPDLASLKAAALAGNFTLSQTWNTLHQSCPGSCSSLGLNSSTWPVYSQLSRLSQCDEPMLLDFALYTPVDQSSGHVSIRGCAADLGTYNSWTTTAGVCPTANTTTNVTSSLQVTWDSMAGDINPYDTVSALEQLYAYELVNPAPCNETINFAYYEGVAMGLYMGSGLHGQDLLASVLENIMQYLLNGEMPENLAVQLCNTHSARYTMGLYISTTGDLTAAQMAVQSWRGGTCVASLGEKKDWSDISYSFAVQGRHNSTLDTLERLRTRASDAPQPDSDDNCYSYLVATGDTCDALATTYGITVDEIESYNNDTWGWMGCDDLLAGENICLSSGWPPMPSVISNAVCGPQVNGTATAPHGTDLSTLNPCPLNACCDIWGQCGTTADFCTPTNSTTGAPGTAANGTNGCISNCGTDIIQSDAPAETFNIGYFEGFDLSRPCMQTWIDDMDLSSYTHIHMSFATLNSDFSFNISTIEEQMSEFVGLSGLKRIITVGGWDFSTDVSTYDIFREAVSTDTNRETLVSNTIAFLNKYDLDGIDWDWEYPGEPDIPGIPADTSESATDFFLFLLELNTAMAEQVPDKTISTTAPSSYWYLKAIPIEAISAVVDYIVLMTYDLHGQWDWNNTYADPGCPDGGCLRSHVNLTETLNSLSMITKAGVSSNQVAVGVASYARSFQMTDAGCYTEDCTFTGPDSGATPGACTQTAGYISNAELESVIEDEEVYMYIDDTSNSNVMVWNETQWAAWMDDDIKAVRKELYASLNFLGSADWAIDLQTSNDTSNSSTTTASTISIDPTVWIEPTPVVTAQPGETLVWPPLPLSSNTTITFPLGQHITVGGNTTVIGGTTTTISGYTFSSGNITYATDPWVGVFGGTTSVVNGTVLAPTTTTVTPFPYPTTSDSTPDPTLNTRTTHRSSPDKSGGGSSGPTRPLLYPGLPLVPPDYDNTSGGGGGGGGGDDGDDDDDDDSTTSTSTETGTYGDAPALATEYVVDAFPTTTDALSALDVLASSQNAWIASYLGTGPASTKATATATNKATATAATSTATATGSATGSSSSLGCYIYQDPDSGSSDTYCECPGYEGTLPTLSGSNICGYTALPTSTTKAAAATTKNNNPYPYTFTDLYGVVVACESASYLDVAGYSLTECAGSRTTEKEVTITVTDVVTTSALSDLCEGGSYYQCVLDIENFGLASCPKFAFGEVLCEDDVFSQAQEECQTLCTFTSSTYTTVYTTLAQ
ncbi:glycoside hydrolase [Penicillium malachiteum]|uniref:chitinase n=1 Tax=Penicillium malachiteum TaxID=1324776 RepID=A0AAD6MVH2_9EURO|nr:glycoside hydrolase [Penicillium malachiteum]